MAQNRYSRESGNPLPEGWCFATISDISYKGKQRIPSESERFIYVDIGSINRDNKTIENPQHLIGKDAPSRARKAINANDILVSLTRPNLNAVALVPLDLDGQIASTGFEVIKTILVDSRYIFGLCRSKHFIDEISGSVQGALYPAAKSSDVQGYRFPLPPLAEQKIIAEKLDTLLAQVATTKARLERIPQILKRFRQSVLTAAVSGKLTEEWRGNHSCEPASEYINQVAQIRDELKKIKVLKKNFGPTEHPEGLFYGIPESWEWVGFEHIAKHDNNALKAGPFGSALKKSDCVSQGYKVYGQEQVIANDERLETYYIDDRKYRQLESCAVAPGDILISLVGTIGKVLILSDNSEKGIINPRLVKLGLQDAVNKNYIKLYLNSPIAHDFFKGFSHGGTMEILNLGILKELPVPFPPLEEQNEIVRRVEQLFAYADSIEQQVQTALARVNNLTQSILAKAFRGELSADWRKNNLELISGNNSAAALLNKIKAEREAGGSKSKRKKP